MSIKSHKHTFTYESILKGQTLDSKLAEGTVKKNCLLQKMSNKNLQETSFCEVVIISYVEKNLGIISIYNHNDINKFMHD